MIHHNVEQYSEEWFKARMGIPTASCFEKIITPKERRLSKSAVKYAYRLLAERVLGKPDIDPQETEYMRRGTVMEMEAALWYAVTRGVEVINGGFVTTDDGRIGCSPDRLVGSDGLLEIKCLGAPGHVGALFGDAETYELQVQAQLWICERAWADRLYYHPELPPVVERLLPDADLHTDLTTALGQFNEKLDEMGTALEAKGCKPKLSVAAGAGEPDASPAPAPPLPTKRERAAELARRLLMCPDDEARQTLVGAFMLHLPNPELSIAGLTDSMLTELENEVTMLEKGI